jgi:hypothetical protein
VEQSPPVVEQPEPPLPHPPECGVISYGPPLNLRVYPNGPVIASYFPGTPVVVNDRVGDWMHVIVPMPGWMFAPYLLPVQCP